ncbi:hypothetical protein [uncultured Roseivirga sp.]|uniref:hypothetical protein n=1 Tax=uncultured Roseivirga sp. TaxID=543088 RepID=UPI000D78EE32|nr:hypothetical protein [uncultured Roseivirga sp.]PWL31954.1 MAG: hypothetical protein DCO95_01880 [Roseivirga sp. XM-24bin3]
MKTSQASGASLGDLRFEYFDQSHHNIFDLNEMKSNLIEAKQFDEKGLLTDSTQFLSGKSEYHQKTTKKSGVSFDFGVFSFGHESEKVSEVKNDSKYVYLLRQAKKTTHKFEVQDSKMKAMMSPDALQMLTDSPKDFYKKYGSLYASKYFKGMHAHLLLKLECKSQEEAESKKSEWKAHLTESDTSADTSLSNNNGFHSFCKKNNVTEYFEHNLSPEIIQKFEEEEKVSVGTLKGRLMLIDKLSSFEPDYANTIETTYVQFDFPTNVFNQITDNNNFINEHNLMAEYEKSEFVLNQIEEYEDNSCNYEIIDEGELQNMKDHHFNKLNVIKKLIGALNEDYSPSKTTDSYKTCIVDLIDKNINNKKLKLIKKFPDLKIATTTSEKSINDVLDSLIDKNKGQDKKENFYCPKFAGSDKLNQHAYGVVIYNTFPITPSQTIPRSDTTWKYETFKQGKNEGDKNQNAKDLVDWIKCNKLTPNQYLHSSILRTDHSNGAKMTLVYPDI